MRNKLVLGTFFLIIAFLSSGCSKSGGSGLFSQTEAFFDSMKAENYSWGYKVAQRFTKLKKQEIKLVVRDSKTKKNHIEFSYDKYGTSGTFDEEIRISFDKSRVYEAALFVGEIQTEWKTLTKMY